jgi:hypothetical protein
MQMKLEPLQQFTCDECGELIKSPKDGWLEWLISTSSDGRKLHGFRIVHHAPASPRKQHNGHCQYPSHFLIGDMHLEHFLGPDGLANLLSMFERPFEDQQEFVEIIRRLHIPYYEEARLYWQIAKDDGFFDEANEYWPYLQDNLKTVIEKYGKSQKRA